MIYKIQDQARAKVRAFLPQALGQTLKPYHDFLGEKKEAQDKNQPKVFSTFHAACKVAISHLEMLIKLAEWADMDTDKDDSSKKFKEMLIEAQQEVTDFKNKDQ